jgi:methionine--tRNA ligase beta chain
MINFEEFQKLNLRIGNIIVAEKVEGSNKLLKLKVDLGSEEKQIIAGIATEYEVEELINRQIVIVANLEPRVIFGLESQGMLLAVNNDGKLALLKPDKEMLCGSKIS